MKNFSVAYTNEPWRNRTFKVRGVCKCDVLNPCWDNRPDDIPGQHWSGLGPACSPCTELARKERPNVAPLTYNVGDKLEVNERGQWVPCVVTAIANYHGRAGRGYYAEYDPPRSACRSFWCHDGILRIRAHAAE